MASAVHTEGLTKRYGETLALDALDLEVNTGEVYGYLGPNGAGKTTTFSIVVGLVRPDAGVVRLGDRDLTDLPMYKRARAGICYLPQEPSVFRKMTVEENLLAILETLDLDAAAVVRRRIADRDRPLHVVAIACLAVDPRDGQPMEFSDAQPGGKSVGVPGNPVTST